MRNQHSFDLGWDSASKRIPDLNIPLTPDAYWNFGDNWAEACLACCPDKDFAEGLRAYCYHVAHGMVEAEVV